MIFAKSYAHSAFCAGFYITHSYSPALSAFFANPLLRETYRLASRVLCAFVRHYVFKLFFHAATLFKFSPHCRVGWAIVHVRRNLKTMAVAYMHIASSAIAHWVVAEIFANVSALTVTAMRPKIAAQKSLPAAFHVYLVTRHISLRIGT